VNTASASGPRGSAGAFQSPTGAQGAGVNTARGGTAAVQTKSGDVYAGHDGNVYKHTDNGWQSYNNGSWQSMQKPTNQPAANQYSGAAQRQPTAQGSAPATQRPTAQPPTTQAPARTQPGTAQPQQRPTMNQSSYQQLEQDRQARMAGRTAPAERGGFQGRSFERGGFEGGGRFHR